jgi:Xaa-Pro aminopeptidase
LHLAILLGSNSWIYLITKIRSIKIIKIMFEANIYKTRRNNLRKFFSSGVAFFPGNDESSMNYPGNTYHFRQDSTFLYFFGLNQPGLAGLIDFESGKEFIFGNDVTIEDIIWMGNQPSMAERASLADIDKAFPYEKLAGVIGKIASQKKKIHYLPPYRGETIIRISSLLDISVRNVLGGSSIDLIKAVISLRSVKDDVEIAEIEKMVDIAFEMHTTAMKMAYPGIYEREIAGRIEGIALSHGGGISFPTILSINGQILHNHYHGNLLKKGRLMVVDAGAESVNGYASDITRTSPVGGKFTTEQKEIYNIVLTANSESIKQIKPGIPFRNVHLNAALIIAEGLKELGLIIGNTEKAVKSGAHALFYPHGLGHMLGLDVHDMEGLGEDFVGYDSTVKRSTQFGTAYLRLAKKLKPGYILTIEPGIYFIPTLIDQWKAERKYKEFINWDKVEKYKNFGGIRIEDNILVTEKGHRVLGKTIPKTIKEIENIMRK